MTCSEAKRFMGIWDKATFSTRSDSIRHHTVKHGLDRDVWKYLGKASNFRKRGAKKIYRSQDDSTLYLRKNGEFLIERNGKIITYGQNEHHEEKSMADVTIAQTTVSKQHVQEKSMLRKMLIATVSASLLKLYQEIRDERARLLQAEYAQEQDTFSAFGDIEMSADTIEGVATEIVRRGRHHAPVSAIHTLEQHRLFASPDFIRWFSHHAEEYPGYSLYVSLTDYLRTLVIDELRQEDGTPSEETVTMYTHSHVISTS